MAEGGFDETDPLLDNQEENAQDNYDDFQIDVISNQTSVVNDGGQIETSFSEPPTVPLSVDTLENQTKKINAFKKYISEEEKKERIVDASYKNESRS